MNIGLSQRTHHWKPILPRKREEKFQDCLQPSQGPRHYFIIIPSKYLNKDGTHSHTCINIEIPTFRIICYKRFN